LAVPERDGAGPHPPVRGLEGKCDYFAMRGRVRERDATEQHRKGRIRRRRRRRRRRLCGLHTARLDLLVLRAGLWAILAPLCVCELAPEAALVLVAVAASVCHVQCWLIGINALRLHAQLLH
jgi:hypothetical protein